MMAYSTVMVIVVVSVLASILLYYYNKQIWEEFDLRASSLGVALSHDLELHVMLEDKVSIENMMEGVLKVQDVLSISVFDENGDLLVQNGDSSTTPLEYRYFINVDINIESDEITEELIEPVKGKGLEKIGSVKIMLSKFRLKSHLNKMISIVIFFMVIVIILRVISDYYFTARLTKPIGKLVRVSEAVANGDLTQRIDIERGDEIGKLASSFSAMLKSLKERDDKIMGNQKQIEANMKKIDASLHEKELLLREIHHRVKNNMQLISSMLKLQAAYVTDKKDIAIFTDCRERIKSMALIHEKLYKTEDMAHIDFKLYVRDLSNELYRSYVVDRNVVGIDINVQNVLLGIETAIPCGLIINELISNSLKHAFPDGRKGEIKITLQPADNLDDFDFELIIDDNGVGLPKDLDLKNTGSLGMELVHTLTTQIDGDLLVNRTGGTEFKIKFKEQKYRSRI